MGYAVKIIDGEVRIPQNKEQEALVAAKNLNSVNELKSGRVMSTSIKRAMKRHIKMSEPSLGDPKRWFAFVPWDYDRRAGDLVQLFTLFRFEAHRDPDNGDVVVHGFHSLCGDERTLLENLAPFIKRGSYLEWEGEENARWRNDFDGKSMTSKSIISA